MADAQAVQGKPGMSQEEAAPVFANLLNPEPSPEPESKDTDNNEEVSEEKGAEEATDDAEAVDEESEETSDESESDESEDEDGEVEAEDEPEEVTEDTLFSVKVDGKDVDVPLKELQAGYMMQKDYTKKTMAIAEDRRKLDADRTEIDSYRQAVLSDMAQKSADLDALLTEFQATDDVSQQEMDRLETEEPDRYLMLKDKARDKQTRIQQAKDKQQAIHAEMQYQQQVQRNDFLVREDVKLLDKLPSWKNDEVRKAEGDELHAYLTKTGWTGEEIGNGLVDHRMVLLARDAMLYSKVGDKKTIANKKVKSKPKYVKPGTSKPRVDKDAVRRKELNKRLKTSGKKEDAGAIFAEMFK